MKRPAEYLPAFEEALQEAVEQEDAAFAKQVNVSHFRIAVNGDFGAHRVTPRGLGGALLNQLACVEGIVTKCSLVRPKVLRSTHYCPATGKFTSKEYRDATSFSGVATGSAYLEGRGGERAADGVRPVRIPRPPDDCPGDAGASAARAAAALGGRPPRKRPRGFVQAGRPSSSSRASTARCRPATSRAACSER